MPPSFPVLSRASLLPVLAIALGGCAAGSTSATLPGGPGAITLTIEGLAQGASGRIEITAPNGDRDTVATSRTLDNLALGVYRLTPLASQAMNHTWEPTEGPRTLVLDTQQPTALASFRYQLATGGIDLKVDGLPASTGTAVRITGPNGFTLDLVGSASLRGLRPGNYQVAALDRTVGTARYTPDEHSTVVTVAPSLVPVMVEFDYTRITGSVLLNVTGVPDGAVAQISIASTTSAYQSVLSTITAVSVLDPGTYIATPQAITWQGHTWLPEQPQLTFTVDTGRVELDVKYRIITGALALEVEGLPAGVAADIDVWGPGEFSRVVGSTESWTGLVPGVYSILPRAIRHENRRFVPRDGTRDITVPPGRDPVHGRVTYDEATGSLQVTVVGLPGNASPRIVVRGPSAEEVLNGSGMLTGLEPGSYTIFAEDVTVGSNRFGGAPSLQNVTITAGQSVSSTVTYGIASQPNSGVLVVNVSGLPAGADAQVTVTGPGGYSRALAASTTITGLAPGSYTISSLGVTAGGTSYVPAPGTMSAAVANNATATRSVVYTAAAPTTGSLAITVTGLPGGSAAAITVSGPGGFHQEVHGSGTLSGLVSGSYTVAAQSVTSGGTTYTGVPVSQNVWIAAGATVSRAVTYSAAAPVTGSLVVGITGLSAGVDADVVVSGPGGYSRALTAGTTISNLAPGTYTITATPVTSGSNSMVPTPASQTAAVVAGATASRAVGYAVASPTTGSLRVTVNGLPSGGTGNITVTGPGGYSQTVSATTTLSGLAVGSYTVTAQSVTVSGNTWVPTPTSQNGWVSAGSTTGRTVTYDVAAPTTGSLTVTVSGLPGGQQASITVTGPAGYSQAVTSTTTLSNLAVGTYTIAPQQVTAGGTTYDATPASQTASVTAGNTASRSVAYAAQAASTGSLAVTVTGVPGGASAAVTVTGPGNYSQSVTSTTTLNNLAAGTYTVAAQAITSGGTTYNPTPASQTASVTAGNTASRSVAYAAQAPTTGSLTITVSGLPGGASGAVTVTGPGNYSQSVTSTTTLNNLAVGTYTVAAQAITSGGTTYNPTPASQTASVTAGNTASRSVAYAAQAPTTGSLTITVSGLPGGASAAVTVTGPGSYSQSVTATTTLSGLAQGSYAIAAAAVTSGGQGYTATPASQNAWVAAGSTASRSVAYAASGGGGSGGNATVTVDTTTRYQVMTGWEAAAQAGHESANYSSFRNTLMSEAAELGISRIRLEIRAGAENTTDLWTAHRNGQISDDEWRSRRYRPVNDNGSPTSADLSKFHFAELDDQVDKILIPLRSAIQARGRQLYVNLNYVGFGSGTQVHEAAAEYAEFLLVTFQHLQSKYGFVPNAIEAILEPDNGTLFSSSEVAAIIVAAGDRLAAAGFHPEFVGPSTMSMANAPTWFDQMASTPRLFTYLKELSYHRYAGVSDANLSAIRTRAAARGIRTAMLEHMGSGVEDLYKDLTIANASAWQQFALAFPTSDNGAQYFTISGSTVSMGSRTKQLRQYFRYVLNGARRVAASSSNGNIRPVAFLNPNGGMAVVLHVGAAGTYTVAGMRPGTYNVEITNNAGTRSTLPAVTLAAGGSVSISPAAAGVLTLYRMP